MSAPSAPELLIGVARRNGLVGEERCHRRLFLAHNSHTRNSFGFRDKAGDGAAVECFVFRSFFYYDSIPFSLSCVSI